MIAALTTEVYALWVWLVGIQREISVAIAATLRGYAATGDWRVLAGFAPWAVMFGVAHALTPGHSKTVLALYLAGTEARMGTALRSAMTLAAVHISSSVVIVVLALPIVSMARGEAGRALLLEDISRGLLGLVGLWLVWSALRPAHDHPADDHLSHRSNTAFAIFAGLVPCPLTLFVMTFATARGVPEAGVAFAAMMIVGVGAVLSAVAMATVLARAGFGAAIKRFGRGLALMSRGILALTGAVLIALAVQQIFPNFSWSV